MTVRALAIGLGLGLGLLAGTALAGDRTSTPPMLRGDAQLTYNGSLGFIRLVDRTVAGGTFTEVARSTHQVQRLTLSGAFSPYHGIAITLDLLPITMHDRIKYSSANDTRIDPDAGVPTLVGGSELSDAVLDASPSHRNHVGFGDMRLGVRAVAFAQSGVPGRQAPANLSFDVAVRIPTGGNHDKVRANGTAGPGLGGPGIELAMTASRRMQGVEPFLSLRYAYNGPYRQALVDSEGVATAPPVDPDEPNPDAEGRWRLDRAERVALRFGAELAVMEDLEADTAVSFEVGAGLEYVGPDEISVGKLLPAPLDSTIGHRAITGEHILVDLGLGLRIRPIRYVEVRVDLGGNWQSPHTLERIGEKTYGVQTAADSFGLQWGLGVRGRIR